MSRTVKPGTPNAYDVKLNKVPSVDFSAFEKIGDAKINAANANFKLYAKNLLAQEQQRLFEQYKADPIMLSNALEKLPEMISDLPEDVQAEMKANLQLNSISLVQKAQENQFVATDLETLNNANKNINDARIMLANSYSGVLRNAAAPVDERNEIPQGQYINSLLELDELAQLKDHNGKDFYSEAQKKKILNVSDVQLESAKQYVDQMILNDDSNLSKTKDYYTKFVLAPERFMKDNFMTRDVYDKFRTYLEKQMERAGVKKNELKFNQSVMEATALQQRDLPGTIKDLLDEGILDKGLVKRIEGTNVKFNDIDPSKAESAATFINAIKIITDQKYLPIPQSQEDQQKVLEQGVIALDSIAEYAQTYGMSPENVKRLRETVVTLETNAAFAPILENFRQIIDNFDEGLTIARNRSTSKAIIKDIMNETGIKDSKIAIKVKELNDLLAVGTDNINALIRNGDWQGVRAEQRRIQKEAAKIKYRDWIDFEDYALKPDMTFTSPNGRVVKIKDFTFDGDIMFETLN